MSSVFDDGSTRTRGVDANADARCEDDAIWRQPEHLNLNPSAGDGMKEANANDSISK